MTDAPTPGRRPRPSPSPFEAGTETGTGIETGTGSGPAPRPAPRPHRTRSARRQAERRPADPRQRRLRSIMLAALGVAVVAGIASAAVALSDSGSGGKHSSSASSGPTGSGAALTDPDRATAFLAAATADVGAVTAYDYRRLDDALSSGLAVTTGSYHTAFQKALTGDVATTARANQVVHQFDVLDLGIGQMNAAGTEAKVLLFGRQLATDRTHRQPQASVITLCATIVRQGDRYRISDLQQDADPGAASGSTELGRAVEAARAEVVNALTYTRAQFDADLRRALAGAGDPLRGQLTADAAATRRAMTAGRYDLSGVVVASAVKSASGTSAELMVAADSSRVGATGSSVTPARYDVTVNEAGGTWVVSRIQALSSQ